MKQYFGKGKKKAKVGKKRILAGYLIENVAYREPVKS